MVTRFSFIGGALCLDFTNTVGGHEGVKILRDKLAGPEDLKRWARQAGLKGQGITPRIFRRAIALREALYRTFVSAAQGRAPAPADLDLFNREWSIARSTDRLRYRRAEFHVESEDIPVISAVIRSAADVIMSDLARLRVCGGDGCAWLFLDTTRNRSRQWCEMRICGNRAKASRFRSKKKARTNVRPAPRRRPHIAV